jgi:phospholipid/cholesterol/gamma-HCH transport system substrate-binding protein
VTARKPIAGTYQGRRDELDTQHLLRHTGASIAPYNHFGLGQPIFIEYVWGCQIGENTINP